jgi:hypothetical protein
VNTQPHYQGVPIQNHDGDHAVQELRNRIKQQWLSLTHPEEPVDLSTLAKEIRRGLS